MTQQIINSVTAEAPSQVTIVWRSGKQVRVDISEYLDSPGYEKLRDPNFFGTAVVEEWGHGIEWADGEMGIDADTLYRLGSGKLLLAPDALSFSFIGFLFVLQLHSCVGGVV